MELPFSESFRIKMVETIRKSTREEREQWIKEAKYNLFNLKSDQVFIDLLTDSGTGAMSDKQWAELMLGDESYAGARSYYKMKNAIKEILGFDYFLPTHQGRAAENVLYSTIIKEGDVLPGNSHFDTTKGHIEFRKALAIDCTIDEAADTQLEIPFKGNMDPTKLEEVLKKYPKEKIPAVVLTVTNNTAVRQPAHDSRTFFLAAKSLLYILFGQKLFAHRPADRLGERVFTAGNNPRGKGQAPLADILGI